MKNLTRIMLVLVLVIPRTTTAFAQDTTTFFIDTVLVDINAPIEVPVYVEHFNDISGFQFSLNWNTDSLTFDSLADFNLQGLNQANFSTTQTDNGVLTVVWFENSLSNITLPDSTRIFSVFYQAFNSCDSTAQVRFSDTPTDQLVVTIDNNVPTEVPANYIDGTVISQCPELEAGGLANGDPIGASGCVPLEVTFTDASSYESDMVSWQWFSGDGQMSTDTNTMFTYSTPGNYTATLVLADAFSTDTATFAIEVFASPDITIDIQQDNCNPQAVTFQATNNGTAAITTWEWDFGDMTSSNLQNPLKLFADTDTNYDITLSVEDENGCTNTFQVSVFVPDFDALSLSVILLESPGCGSNTGEVALAPSGGTPPYTYGWSHDAMLTDSIATGLAAGDYDITLTDAENCTVEFTYTLESQDDFPVVALGADTSYCQGASLVLDAGNDGTTYIWALDGQVIDGETDPILEAMTPGTYDVLVINDLGCSTADTVVVAELPSPMVMLPNDTTLCENESIVLDAQNPGATFGWSLDGMTLIDETGSTLTATEAGTYIVGVTNSDNCAAQDTFVLTLDTAPLPDLGPNQSICAGETTTLDANASGTYVWALDGATINGATDQQLDVSEEGQYTVVVTNANNCSGTDTLELVVAPLPMVNLGPGQTFCEGETVILDAGNSGASFSWSQDGNVLAGEENSTLEVMEAGMYAVTVTNTDNCSSSDTIMLGINPLPTLDLGEDQSICEGESTTLSSVSDAMSFQWFLNGTPIDGATMNNLDASEAGIYVLEATSMADCTNADTVELLVNALPEVDLGADTFFCGGMIEFILDADNPGATFIWFENGMEIDGETNSTLLVNAAGTYSVSVTDNNNCSSTDELTIEESGMLGVVLGADTLICEGESVLLQSGADMEMVQWFVDGAPIAGATDPDLVVDDAGTYSVTLSAGGDCMGSDTVVVEIAPLPEINFGAPPSLCPGDSTTLMTNTTGQSFMWTLDGELIESEMGDTLVTNSPGLYGVTVISSENCQATATIDVSANPEPFVEIGADTSFCSNTSLNLNAGNPGSTYQWLLENEVIEGATNPIFNPQSTGNYGVIVTNPEDCQSSDFIFVEVLQAPEFNVGADTSFCENDSLILNVDVDFGDIFQWFLNNQPISGANTSMITINQGGIYTLNVNNENDCLVGDALTVTGLVAPDLNLGPDTTFCPGDTYLIETNSNAETFEWFLDGNPIMVAPPQSFGASQAGTYIVDVATGSCTASDTLFLGESPIPMVDAGPDTTLCEGETLTLQATSDGTTLTWRRNNQVVQQGPELSLDIALTGTYTIVAENEQGCTAIDTVLVSGGSFPIVALGPDRGLCMGDSLTLTVSNAIDYSWFINDMLIDTAQGPNLTVVGPGTIQIIAVSEDNCTAQDEIVISEIMAPPVGLAPDTSICTGTSLLVEVACTNCTASWNDGSMALSRPLSEAGTYTVEVTDPQGCAATDTITLDLLALPMIGLGDSLSLCPAEQVTLSAGDFESYLWSTGATTSSIDIEAPANTPGQTIEYWLEVTDANNCENRDTIAVEWLPTVIATISASPINVCEGDTVLLSATGGLYYDWAVADSIISATDIADPLGFPVETTVYQVFVSDDCPSNIDSAMVSIKVDPAPDASAGQDTCIVPGLLYEMNATGGVSYSWEENELALLSDLTIPNPTLRPTVSSVYYVNITGDNGCVLRDSVEILVATNPLESIQTVNIITPNGDGQNDILIFDGLEKFDQNTLTIFNRWGNIVFQDINYENDWDGTFNGADLPPGTYFYVLRIMPGDNVIKSSLTIVRE